MPCQDVRANALGKRQSTRFGTSSDVALTATGEVSQETRPLGYACQ